MRRKVHKFAWEWDLRQRYALRQISQLRLNSPRSIRLSPKLKAGRPVEPLTWIVFQTFIWWTNGKHYPDGPPGKHRADISSTLFGTRLLVWLLRRSWQACWSVDNRFKNRLRQEEMGVVTQGLGNKTKRTRNLDRKKVETFMSYSSGWKWSQNLVSSTDSRS